MKRLSTLSVSLLLSSLTFASFVPLGHNDNKLYYKIGGGSNFVLPPMNDTRPINLNAGADLSLGLGCNNFNPALSITNSINEIKDDVDNLEQSIVSAATGSIAAMPMYMLAKANPNAYNYLNNAILSAHERIALSVKSCERIRSDISQGKNPYADWATLSVGDQWKKHLSLTASGNEDINDVAKDIDQHGGDEGVSWIQGNKNTDGALHAGGANQPPIHVIADTVKAGYNAILMRDLNSNDPAPASSELSTIFTTPTDAMNWITAVVGDQTITTCNDATCKNNQGTQAGHGLLPAMNNCDPPNKNDCIDTLRTQLINLISAQSDITKENLQSISGPDLFITPEIISAIHHMNTTQQSLLINKLAEEISTQRIIEKALMARTLLRTGSQVPVITANQPAQHILDKAIAQLDKDIQSTTFEANVRKQLLSNTLTEILDYQHAEQNDVATTSVTSQPAVLNNSALPNPGEKS